MTMDVIYSPKMRLKDIKKKSKQFFSGSEYKSRNDIYTYPNAMSSYNIGKRTVHISVSQNNQLAMNEIVRYLSTVFGESLIGIRTSDTAFFDCLDKINYYKV